MKFHLSCIVAALLAIFSAAHADPITDRLDSIERRVAAVERIVSPTPPAPATQPTTQPATPVRADTAAAIRAAVASGATWIQTAGIDLNDTLDARGAIIELLPGGPSWKPAVSLNGNGSLLNAVIKTPPSKFDANGNRTGFSVAVTSQGSNMTLRGVTFAPDVGFCIHHFSGTLTLDAVKATTFSEYFVFQEPGSFISAKGVEVRGGSRAESVWRLNAARYLIEDSVLDNSAGGKAVLRGDSPAFAGGSPGGVVRRTSLVGNVGPNPLTEDDGGQMLGIDRWRFAEGWIYQLPYTRHDEAIAFARGELARGRTAFDVARACADRFVDGAQLANVARGKTRLSDSDITLTLTYRATEVGRRSTFLIEDSSIVGDFRINARATGIVRNTPITAGNGLTPFSINSQPTYPWPVDRALVQGEAAPAPDITFDRVTINGGAALGIDLRAFPALKFQSTTYKGAAIAVPVQP